MLSREAASMVMLWPSKCFSTVVCYLVSPKTRFCSPQYTTKNMEMVELLLARKFADVNARSVDGTTPLMCIFRRWDQQSHESSSHRSRIVSMLLENGADVHLRSSHGMTVLHHAAEFVHSSEELFSITINPSDYETFHEDEVQEILAALLTYGADPDAQDDWGRTPLHRLAECFQHGRYWTPFEILLFRGANSHVSDVNGQTPYSILRETCVGWTYVQEHAGYFIRAA